MVSGVAIAVGFWALVSAIDVASGAYSCGLADDVLLVAQSLVLLGVACVVLATRPSARPGVLKRARWVRPLSIFALLLVIPVGLQHVVCAYA